MGQTTKKSIWHTQIAGYVYVDGDLGSDELGAGTMAKPYRTLDKAIFPDEYPNQSLTSQPKNINIVCRGLLRSPGCNIDGIIGVNCGSHNGTQIRADYFGAAIYDGEGNNILCGQSLRDMIVINCPQPKSTTVTIAGNYFLGTSYGVHGGLGRASAAFNVAYAHSVYGLYSSSCVVHDVPLWYGVIGSNQASTPASSNAYHVYSKIKPTASDRVSLGSFMNCTVYDCPLNYRKASYNKVAYISMSLFGKFAFGVNDSLVNIGSSVFAADCEWWEKTWYISATYDTYSELPLRPSSAIYVYVEDQNAVYYGNTSTKSWVKDSSEGIGAKFKLNESLTATTKQGYSEQFEGKLRDWFGDSFKMTISNCIFSCQSSTELMNDPENLDFTLTIDSDAYFNEGELWYAGAMNRAMRIKAATDENGGTTDGMTMCWDNQTKTGCITINNGQVVYNTNATNNEGGSILSKVVKVERATVNVVRGLFNYFASHTVSHGFKLNANEMFELIVDPSNSAKKIVKKYNEVNYLPDNAAEDLYMVLGTGKMYVQKAHEGWSNDNGVDTEGSDVYTISPGYTAWISSNDAIQRVDENTDAYFAKVVNPDVTDVIYVRANGTVEAVAEADGGGSLTTGAVYYNDTDGKILINGGAGTPGGRTICKGGSFVAKSNGSFTRVAGNTGGEVLKIFDDTTSKWAPANMMTDYWTYKNSSDMVSHNGEVLSSGNPDSYNNDVNKQNGVKTGLAQKWLQFKIEASKMYLDPTVQSSILQEQQQGGGE